MLLSLPVVFGVTSLVLALLSKWWARVVPASRVPKPQWQVPLAVVVLLAVVELALGAARGDDAMEWVGAALMVFGPSYATFAVLGFRAVIRRRPSEAFGMGHAVALLVASPAVFMALGLVGEPMELIVVGWFYSGGLGLVPVVVGGALLLEAAHRGRRVRPSDDDTAKTFD